MFKVILVIILIITTFGVYAGDPPLNCTEVPGITHQTQGLLAIVSEINGCPKTELIGSICSSIYKKTEDTDEDSPFDYIYEQKIYEASCVDVTVDSEEEISRKIRVFWDKSGDKLTCEDATFAKAYILKYAAYNQFSNFLWKATNVWKVPLNTIDNGMTTLDYIQKEIQDKKGTPVEKTLTSYFELLRKAGAKYKCELPEYNCQISESNSKP